MNKLAHIDGVTLVNRRKHVIRALEAQDFEFKTPIILHFRIVSFNERKLLNFSALTDETYSIFDGKYGLSVSFEDKKTDALIRFELYRFDKPNGTETSRIVSVQYLSSGVNTEIRIAIGESENETVFRSSTEFDEAIEYVTQFVRAVRKAVE